MDARPLLTIKDLCAKFQLDRRTIYNMINRGELHPVRVGGAYRFTPESIDRYLSQSAERRYRRWELRDAERDGD